MLITASIALNGASLGGPSALFETPRAEAVPASEASPITFRSDARSPWCRRPLVTPLDDMGRAVLEQTLGSHSVKLLLTETVHPNGNMSAQSVGQLSDHHIVSSRQTCQPSPL